MIFQSVTKSSSSRDVAVHKSEIAPVRRQKKARRRGPVHPGERSKQARLARQLRGKVMILEAVEHVQWKAKDPLKDAPRNLRPPGWNGEAARAANQAFPDNALKCEPRGRRKNQPFLHLTERSRRTQPHYYAYSAHKFYERPRPLPPHALCTLSRFPVESPWFGGASSITAGKPPRRDCNRPESRTSYEHGVVGLLSWALPRLTDSLNRIH